jgi:hypothetical protein
LLRRRPPEQSHPDLTRRATISTNGISSAGRAAFIDRNDTIYVADPESESVAEIHDGVAAAVAAQPRTVVEIDLASGGVRTQALARFTVRATPRH